MKQYHQEVAVSSSWGYPGCRFCKDIIEVNKAGERYIITVFSGGVKEYEHWKCYQQQMFTKVLQNIFGGADNYI
jgi:hypothetical protein